MLSGTLYFGESMLSEEYLIFKSVLEKQALKHNLKLVKYESFKEYYTSLYNLNNEFYNASMLNGVFVLEKVRN